jgi:hypothetical protein
VLVAVAVCPHPPLLVPQLAGARLDGGADDSGADDPADPTEGIVPVRRAALRAVRRISAHRPVVVACVGNAPVTRRYPPSSRGSLRGYGVAVHAGLGPAADGPAVDGSGDLPPSLTIGGWLLARAGDGLVGDGYGVAAACSPPRCAEIGARLAADLAAIDGPTALLVLADGSACHGEKSPGYADERAEGFDRTLAGALAGADTATLAGMAPDLAAQLRCEGRAPLGVLAAAVAATGGDWRGELLHSSTPYGVGYHCAVWERR